MKLPAPGAAVTQDGAIASRSFMTWLQQVSYLLTGLSESGTTADRPTKGLWVGRPYFDTTLGQPIWYDGTGWVDATGASA